MTTPQTQRHAQTQAVFLFLCDLPLADRDATLTELCGDDTDLRSRVEALLEAESDAGFLAPLTSMAPVGAEDVLPACIGPYRVVSLLGRGGTATVYACEQDKPRRRVAVKVLRRLWASPAMMRRLELEAEALARLQHPGIAAVFDVGTAEGAPYLAMELVDGTRITAYAMRQGLDKSHRLALFAGVCDAVQHAHQRAVIHRDLKPANILVKEDGQAKIVDFGVARLTDIDIQHTTQTELGSVLGTLAYMSPEQAAGQARRVDARTDVYSLGAVLYELLSGLPPIDVAGRPVPAALRAIQEEIPVPLGKVDRSLRGDLSVIAAKALEKEPERRYQAASALATDVRRFLAHETILARPATVTDQLQSLVKRNRGLVVGAAIAVVALAGGAGIATAQAVRARMATLNARMATRDATNLVALLKQVIPDQNAWTEGNTPALSRRLEALEKLLSETQTLDPAVLATLHVALGHAYEGFANQTMNSDAAARQESNFLTAWDLYRQARGDDHRDTLNAKRLYAGSLEDVRQSSTDGSGDPQVRLLREVVQRAESLYGRADSCALAAHQDLGSVLIDQGKHDEVEDHIRIAYEGRLALFGADNGETAESMSTLGVVLMRQGRTEEAEKLLRGAVDIRLRIFGRLSRQTDRSIMAFADLLRERADWQGAIDYCAMARDIRQEALGTLAEETLRAQVKLARIQEQAGRLNDAEQTLRELWSRRSLAYGPNDKRTLEAQMGTARLCELAGRIEEAEALRADVRARQAEIKVQPKP